jgi:hypothetical protein
VVHVPVRDADDVAGQGEVGTPADVEADVQFRDLADRFLARDAVPDDMERADGDFRKLLNQKRLFRHGPEGTGGREW